MKKTHKIFFILIYSVIFLFTNKSLKVNAMEQTVNHIIHNSLVTIVDDSTLLTTPIASITDEDYRATSKKWNGMPTVITCGNNIFVAWQTGGVREPDPNALNYITIAASNNGGLSWIDPFIIIDDPKESVECRVPQFYYNHAGVLQLLFYKSDSGINKIEFYNADGNLNNITYSKASPIGVNNSSFTKPTLLSNGEIMYASSAKTQIFVSKDDGNTFKKTVEIKSASPEEALRFGESTIVEKKDGTLWCLRRLENSIDGGIEQSFSLDGGKNWSIAKGNLPYPLTSPGSRFTMKRLKSGNLAFVTNAQGMGSVNRQKMTIYLSEDDGESWPYSLLLDNVMSSYPDIWQDENETIYVTFDKDRYGEAGIRLCTMNEQDIKDGAYKSSVAKQLLIVSKANLEYNDIRYVVGEFKTDQVFYVGTEAKEIVKSFNTKITVIDDLGNAHEVEGMYKISGYKKDVAGTYDAYFVPDALPSTLKDSYNIFTFKITTVEKKEGCKGNVKNVSLIILVLSIISLLKLKKGESL